MYPKKLRVEGGREKEIVKKPPPKERREGNKFGPRPGLRAGSELAPGPQGWPLTRQHQSDLQ